MFDDFANRQIGDFIVQERIGRGAMSVVYRAVQQSVNRSVSLKVINLNLNPLAKENYQPYFMQEAKVIATLEHIHIVPVYNYGTVDEESSFIAMRLLRGGSVQELLRAGPLGLDRAIDIFTQAAQGLAHAHNRGIIHRDLKPTNLLLDDLSNAYLTDFGLGKLAEVSLDLTDSGHTIGTALYASPEQLTGEPIDYRTDIYSMSAVLYHMLTGQPPFTMETGGLMELIHKQETETPRPLREFDASIPDEVNEVVLQGLRRNPADRPESIEAMADSLNLAMGRRISRSSDPVVYISERTRVRRPPRRYAVPGAIVLALAAALIFGVVVTTRPSAAGPTVLAGERGSPDDIVPSEDEIALAQERLGNDGFIAYIACTLDGEFQAAQARMMADRAEDLGLRLRVYDSHMERYAQITNLERARLEGARALVLCALDPAVLNESLEAAQKAGVPLVYVTPQEARFGGVVVDARDYDLGREAGRIAGEIMNRDRGGRGRVVILELPGLGTSDHRVEGMLSGLTATAPDAEVVARVRGATAESAERSIRDLLREGTRFDLILSTSDSAALGAVRALEAAGVSPDEVAIVSINGETLAKRYVHEGHYFRAVVGADLDRSPRAAVDAAVRLLAGGTVPEFIISAPGDTTVRGSGTTAAAES